MATELKDILDKKEPAEKPAEVVEAKPEEKPEVVEADKPEVIAEPEKVEAEPQERQPSREAAGLKAATTAERNKRQQAERERDELRQELDRERSQFRQEMAHLMGQFAPKQPEQPIPSVFEDPEGWQQRQSQTYEQRIRQTEVKMSERLARVQHGDDVYNAAEKAIETHYRTNPNDPIFVAIQRSDDPAGVLVRWHQERTQLSSLSNPEGKVALLKEAIQDPAIKAMILEALGQEVQPKPAAAPAPTVLPSNLAGARSVRGQGAVFTGATPLKDILSRK